MVQPITIILIPLVFCSTSLMKNPPPLPLTKQWNDSTQMQIRISYFYRTQSSLLPGKTNEIQSHYCNLSLQCVGQEKITFTRYYYSNTNFLAATFIFFLFYTALRMHRARGWHYFEAVECFSFRVNQIRTDNWQDSEKSKLKLAHVH